MARNVRVEIKPGGDPQKAFRQMLKTFTRRCDEYGIKSILKEHESHETKSQKRRRKKREAARNRQKQQWKG